MPAHAAESAHRPLQVVPAACRLRAQVLAALARGADDSERTARRQAVIAVLDRVFADVQPDSIHAFESILNGCLDVGYRAEPLAAFVFEVLNRRWAARVRRRLARAGQDPHCDEVADLVAATAEAVHGLLRGACREQHSLRYALLLAIADHRTIDHLRRRRPEYRESMDDRSDGGAPWTLGTARHDPEQQMVRRQRLELARALRAAVLEAVNELPDAERAALVLVEIDGRGYDEIADALGVKRTDVGNLVRRARLRRDRTLMPLLRDIPGLEGHIGFGELQDQRALRLNMLRWTTEMGDGVCARCLHETHRLHTGDKGCVTRPAEAASAALAGAR
ncbi:MAG: hypothetical protein KC620_06575 [Myxococcales bacterium]|nr:hypothetical protein [Myxococcales bacterium]